MNVRIVELSRDAGFTSTNAENAENASVLTAKVHVKVLNVQIVTARTMKRSPGLQDPDRLGT